MDHAGQDVVLVDEVMFQGGADMAGEHGDEEDVFEAGMDVFGQ